MASDNDPQFEHIALRSVSSSSTLAAPSIPVVHPPSPPSPISPLQPIYPIDSLVTIVGGPNNGGVFLFETEGRLVHTNKYVCTLCAVCIFGCWICTIPSVIATICARTAVHQNRLIRAKIMFNIAFIFSFFGLLLFAVQAGYLIWLTRFFLHRFITK